jgi:hypothetical protein
MLILALPTRSGAINKQTSFTVRCGRRRGARFVASRGAIRVARNGLLSGLTDQVLSKPDKLGA